MSPVQVISLPINDELVPYAEEIDEKLRTAGLRTEVDGRTESLNKKIREAQLNQIPLILTIGAKERDAGTLSVRTLDGTVRYGISLEDFMNRTLSHIENRKLNLDTFWE